MAQESVKQQIIDTIKEVDNVLVTVGSNPSVDVLSAALGVTLVINKLNKHATAVFSGSIPPAISFLDPEKTFEDTVDSLRDFIIALDKEKADHLRYKVDGDLVKIFITPYRTVISEKDLDYSSGDYNVEMVIALDVENEEDLDKALSDHGRIMHDATVVSVSIGSEASELGTLQWHEQDASSYSELMVGVADGLRDGKNLLDEQTSTALLTGIVAATERFSNEKTTSGAMTVAAQLMAAGANQQLIAIKLEEASQEPLDTEGESETGDSNEDSVDEGVGKPAPIKEKASKKPKQDDEPIVDRPAADGTMLISHAKRGDVDDVAKQVEEERQSDATEEAERELSKAIKKPSAVPSLKDMKADLDAAKAELDKESESDSDELPALPSLPPVMPPKATDIHSDREEIDKPTFGGVLNATSEQAAIDKRNAELEDQNKTILKHEGAKYVGNQPSHIPPLNSFTQTLSTPELPSADPLSTDNPTTHVKTVEEPTASEAPESPKETPQSNDSFALSFEPAPTPPPMTAPLPPSDQAKPEPKAEAEHIPTLNELDEAYRTPANNSPSPAIDEALKAATSTSEHKENALPDISTLPPLQTQTPANDGSLPPLPPPPASIDGLPPLPPLPPMSEPTRANTQNPETLLGNMLPPLPTPPASTTPPIPTSATNDPNQFRIPGQS